MTFTPQNHTLHKPVSHVVKNNQLQEYLNSFLLNPEKYTYPRVQCPCTFDAANTGASSSAGVGGGSKALYCTDCSRLLIPRDQWPLAIQNGQLDLPFYLDILLSDKRRSSSGFHALVLYRASRQGGYDYDGHRRGHGHGHGHGHCDGGGGETNDSCSNQQRQEDKVRLFDLEKGDALPNYHHHHHDNDDVNDDNDNALLEYPKGKTFVLFPSKTSVPISTVADKIHRLIVLDSKWTKTNSCIQTSSSSTGASSSSNSSNISSLPHVHLDHPPTESFYWRWHNAGPGRISTMEAIYFAILEVMMCKNSSNDNNSSDDNDDDENSGNDKKKLCCLEWMWLFGIQRAATAKGALQRGKPLPFSSKGKQVQRELRRTEKGSEKHLRDIANGKRLKDQIKYEK